MAHAAANTPGTSPTITHKPKSKLPPRYDHYYGIRNYKSDLSLTTVISGIFTDVFSEVTNKVTDRSEQIRKLKVVGGFVCCGLLGGHTYSAYRGFTRLQLYSRHILVGGGMGTLCAFPVLSFMSVKHKQHPNAYILIRGGLFGSICGLVHRGAYRYMLPYGLMGVAVHSLLLMGWYSLVKPVYYFHFLAWPDYCPPKWWPVQPMSGMEVYLMNCRWRGSMSPTLRIWSILESRTRRRRG